MLTREKLRHLLDYNPASGVFTWRVSKSGTKVGQVTGSIEKVGYLRIMIDGKSYKAHRLAWLWMTGEFPPDHIDHVNRVRSDNRWANLRAATRSQNNMNSTRKHNTSGKKGVTWNNASGKWQAQISVDGKRHHLGLYNDIEDAAVAYSTIAKILHGEFNLLENDK